MEALDRTCHLAVDESQVTGEFAVAELRHAPQPECVGRFVIGQTCVGSGLHCG